MWKTWSPSRKLAGAVVLIVAVVAIAAAVASGGKDSKSSAASAGTSTGAGSTDGSSSGSTGKGSTGPGGPSSTTASTVPPPLPVQPKVEHTTGLHSGDEVTVTVTADKGSQIFAVEMRMCRAGTVIGTDSTGWLPSVTGDCASRALAPGTDGYKAVSGAPPFDHVTATYKVGTGTDTYKLDDGTSNSVTCDSSHPCVLAVKYQIPNGFGFRTYHLTFS